MTKLLPRLNGERVLVLLGLIAFWLVLILMLLGLSSCATANSTREIKGAAAEGLRAGVVGIPPEAAKHCTAAALPEGKSIADYRLFGLLQTDKLQTCEERRALAVDAMELHNTAMEAAAKKVEPKPWWKFW